MGGEHDLGWQRYRVPLGELRLHNEALRLLLRRETSQWQLSFKYATTTPQKSTPDATGDELWLMDEWERFIFATTHEQLELRPALPDRPIISRPISPLRLQPREKVSIFVATPLWAQLWVHDPAVMLRELPLAQLSDTWFGPSTLTGELCYATETHARLALADTPRSPFRATTCIQIENQADDALLIERLNLPAPLLTLYHDRDGRYWTDTINIQRRAENSATDSGVTLSTPKNMSIAAKARKSDRQDLLSSAFTILFG